MCKSTVKKVLSKKIKAILGTLPFGFEYVVLRYISEVFKVQIDFLNEKMKLICSSKFEAKSAKVLQFCLIPGISIQSGEWQILQVSFCS